MIRAAEARRIALAAQGLHLARSPRRFHDAMRRVGALQLDFVNVLVPAHFLTLYARLGPYSREAIHKKLYREGRYTEQWAHEAAIVPVEAWPWLRFRREAHPLRPKEFARLLARSAGYADWVLAQVRARGGLPAGEIPVREDVAHRLAESWYGTMPRATLELHFGQGRIAIANRLPNFARVYDLAERVIAEPHYSRQVTPAESRLELIRSAARSCGLATARDLADYYRMKPAEARPSIEALVRSGELEAVDVEGWRDPGLLHAGAERPRKVEACSMLSPFDPVVWFRPRAKRVFGFSYRIEIYTPAAKRRFGYYVLPFLLGDEMVARVDLKADRAAGRLLVMKAWIEPGQKKTRVAPALLDELRTLGRWLELDPPARVDLTPHGARGENGNAERE